ncbi:MAG: hypothetical protein P8129_14040 [Anaerolineae bacterium]
MYDLIAQNGSFVKFVERWIVDPTRWGPAALTVLKFADGQNIKNSETIMHHNRKAIIAMLTSFRNDVMLVGKQQ